MGGRGQRGLHLSLQPYLWVYFGFCRVRPPFLSWLVFLHLMNTKMGSGELERPSLTLVSHRGNREEAKEHVFVLKVTK